METKDNIRGRKATTYASDTSRQLLRGGLQNGQCNPLRIKVTFDVTDGGEVAGFKALTNDNGAAGPVDADFTFLDDTGTEIGAQKLDGGALLEWRLELTSQTATEVIEYAGKEGRIDASGTPVLHNLR